MPMYVSVLFLSCVYCTMTEMQVPLPIALPTLVEELEGYS